MTLNENSSPILAIVVPCYNEAEVLPLSNSELTLLLEKLIPEGRISEKSYILYVDDASDDDTWDIIERLSTDPHIRGLKLSHNTGQQNAIWAGLEYAAESASAVITLDADLQDDISVIPRMLELYGSGKEIVYGVRKSRKEDSPFKRRSAAGYYRLMKILGVEIINDHGEFRLLGRKALKALLEYPERNIFIRGLVPQLGFSSEIVYYSRLPRRAGISKYPLGKMASFAVNGITSLSVRPVRMIFNIGILFILIALVILTYVLCSYFSGETIKGWSSLMISVWFVGGFLLTAMGILGEYIGKIYTEVKKRPRYHIDKYTECSDTKITD